MCAEHVLGVSSGWGVEETRRDIVRSDFDNKKSVFDVVSCTYIIGDQLSGNKPLVGYKGGHWPDGLLL